MLKWIIAIIVIATVIGLAVNYQPEVPVTTHRVERGLVQEFFEERAKTRVPEVYRISMPLDGRVLPIQLVEGDAVSSGQVVARMDPDDLQTDLSMANARVLEFDHVMASLQKTVEAAKAEIEASEAKFQFAEKEYKRKSTLAEKDVVSDAELEAAELLQLESRVDQQTDVLNWRGLQAIADAMGIYKSEATETAAKRRRDRERAEIRSPVSGVVLQRLVNNERVLRAGETLLEIGRPEELEIEADILTSEASRIESGTLVEITGQSLGTTILPGTVKRIYPQAFTKVSSLGVEQQRVKVIIEPNRETLAALKKSGRSLGIDYRVQVKVIVETKSNAFRLPRTAIFRGPNGIWQCYQVVDGKASLTELTLGLRNDFEVEVVEGVAEGDQVIIAPDSTILDGVRVAIHADTNKPG